MSVTIEIFLKLLRVIIIFEYTSMHLNGGSNIIIFSSRDIDRFTLGLEFIACHL